ncbi:hypothetical protein [Aminobacterium mobile]|uniref:hypothetical protein n=1 Tax=Aminobacterium mobile TaxID=81467 RepID=UPI002FE3131B
MLPIARIEARAGLIKEIQRGTIRNPAQRTSADEIVHTRHCREGPKKPRNQRLL